MTTPQVTTVKKGGSRIYVDDLTGERQPGVTSILNMMAKPGLRYWFAKMVAEEAVDSFSTIMDLVGKQRHDGAVDFLKRAPGRHSGRAADRGTIVHGLIERMNRGEELGNIHPDFEGYVRHYEDFLHGRLRWHLRRHRQNPKRDRPGRPEDRCKRLWRNRVATQRLPKWRVRFGGQRRPPSAS